MLITSFSVAYTYTNLLDLSTLDLVTALCFSVNVEFAVGSTSESSKENESPIVINVPLKPVQTLAQKSQDLLKSQQGIPPSKQSLKAYEKGSEEFRQAVSSLLLPRLKEFNPDIILLSAGFDGHFL